MGLAHADATVLRRDHSRIDLLAPHGHGMGMLRYATILLLVLFTVLPARAEPAIDAAFGAAIAAFEKARPRLGGELMGVDIAAYRDALALRNYYAAFWGQEARVVVQHRRQPEGSCSRYAAFVSIPPDNGQVPLVICPEFINEGTDALRRLTVLHEIVHVVAGPDECRAMAFAARIEYEATGAYTPVDRYWQANGCAGGAFSLP